MKPYASTGACTLLILTAFVACGRRDGIWPESVHTVAAVSRTAQAESVHTVAAVSQTAQAELASQECLDRYCLQIPDACPRPTREGRKDVSECFAAIEQSTQAHPPANDVTHQDIRSCLDRHINEGPQAAAQCFPKEPPPLPKPGGLPSECAPPEPRRTD